MKIATKFKGNNYLVWSRMARNAIGGKGLLKHLTSSVIPKQEIKEKEEEEDESETAYDKWQQADCMVINALLASLDQNLMDAYSYCDTAKELWDTLKQIYGNTSNLNRVFEVKQALNSLVQEDMDFEKHLGKYRALWSELEMLRPNTIDPMELNKRREQDKVFGLLLTLNPAYGGFIQHMLRDETLPNLEEVCARIQKEYGNMELFNKKGKELALANQAAQAQGDQGELAQANKAIHGKYEKFGGSCDHCKKQGHKKSQCWILHPHLKPAKFKEAKAHMVESSGGGASKEQAGEMDNGKSLVAYTGGPSSRGSTSGDEYLKRSDLDVLIKLFKEHGNTLAYSHGASMIARTDRLLEDSFDMYNHLRKSIFDRIDHAYDSAHAYKPSSILVHLANSTSSSYKPLIVDSGASHHMISDTRLINNIEPAHGNVMIANGAKIPIKGIGELKLFDKDSKALYMPDFTSNLLSVKKCATDLNCNVIFSPNSVKFQDIESHKVLGSGLTKGDLYVLENLSFSAPSSKFSCSFSSASTSLSKNALWHARLGHPHNKALKLMLPGVSFENNDCEACILGKHCKTVFPNSSTIYENCFDLVHSDVWTAPCLSRENQKYYVTFIDEKSKYTWLTLIPTKDRVLDAFRNFQTYVINQYHAKIKVFRSDNGGEYISNAFKQHLSGSGILHQTSCPYTPQQNGVAERKNRHLMEVARSLMFQANVPKRFWSDAVVTACYLINRTPTLVLQGKSPFEVLNKYKPVLSHLKVFGCLCYVMVPGELRNKLEARSSKAMFIGYSTSQKGYKCYDEDTRRVMISREVKFVEERGYFEEKNQEDLKDLASDRATVLRTILENLGINVNQGGGSAPRYAPTTTTNEGQESAPVSAPVTDGVHVPTLDHEGGNESETLNQGMGESSSSGQESSSSHDQSGDQGVEPMNHQGEAEASGDQGVEPVNHQGGAEASGDDAQEEDNVEEPEPVQGPMLRRSTRNRKPSKWVNTRVYYNARLWNILLKLCVLLLNIQKSIVHFK